MKLYSKPGACSTADHIALQWTGQPFEVEVVTATQIKEPGFLALNPAGSVPVIVDGDFVLTQNAAIMGYIADSYPDAGLAGDNSPRQRAEATRWLYPQPRAAVMNAARSCPMTVPGTSRQIEENLRCTRYSQLGWSRPVTSRNVMNGRVPLFAVSCTASGSCSQARTTGHRRRNVLAQYVNAVLPRPVRAWWAWYAASTSAGGSC